MINKKVFITGGAGFIGTNFIELYLMKHPNDIIINLDVITYAANLGFIKNIKNDNHIFVEGNILDKKIVKQIFDKYEPDIIINFAAESHVDRSFIYNESFIKTNINGTFNLLDETYEYWSKLSNNKKDNFRFMQISTDEVFGSLDKDTEPLLESARYNPTNPYSASKASADHLVKSWYYSYKLPTIITNCSNNYGKYQNKEKFIPATIYKAINNKEITIYGNGQNIRDWIHVKDHCRAIIKIMEHGKIGEQYNISANNEKTNINLALLICNILDKNTTKCKPHKNLIKFVKDRPSHDFRYSINCSKLKNLGWKAIEDFNTTIEETIYWYLNNQESLQIIKENIDV